MCQVIERALLELFLEAMAIGRPIITTNVAGCRHLINKNGFLVKPKSSKALKVVMERFINDII